MRIAMSPTNSERCTRSLSAPPAAGEAPPPRALALLAGSSVLAARVADIGGGIRLTGSLVLL